MKLIIDVDEELYKAYKGRPPMLGDAGMDMIAQAIANGIPYDERPQGDLISREDLKKHKLTVQQANGVEIEDIDVVPLACINNAPAVEYLETPFITECRNAAIEQNLPLYFVYYEETGILEVYVTETKELFEKRRCSKHLPDYEFKEAVIKYLDWYSDWKDGEEE